MINIIWKGGPRWDPNATSNTNPSKKKSAIEHLIETGGQTIDETITALQKFGSFSLDVTQHQPEDTSINWITSINIKETNKDMFEFIKTELMNHYEEKKKWLEESNTGYSISILVDE